MTEITKWRLWLKTFFGRNFPSPPRRQHSSHVLAGKRSQFFSYSTYTAQKYNFLPIIFQCREVTSHKNYKQWSIPNDPVYWYVFFILGRIPKIEEDTAKHGFFTIAICYKSFKTKYILNEQNSLLSVYKYSCKAQHDADSTDISSLCSSLIIR